MSRKSVLDAHGYASPTEAARALGVSTQTIYNHIDRYGALDQVHLEREPVLGHAVAMPDGSMVGSKAEAARILGCSTHKVAWHLQRHGHLRLAQGDAVRLPDAAAVEDDPAPPGDQAAAPRASGPSRKPVPGAVDVEAVIETIRQCRDQYLEEVA